MKNFFNKYKHAWLLLYLIIYIPCFFYLEGTIVTNYTPVHMFLDDIIPFNELFVIPYYLWFGFVFLTMLYLFFTSTTDFYKGCAFLFIGMTICLTIYTIWPNGQDLRPDLDALGRNNALIDIVRNLYRTDTNTNVCPSIHVYNSIGIQVAIFHNEKLNKHKWLLVGTTILTILICLSTMFLKQHSAVDVLAAIILSAIMYVIVYVPNYSKRLNKVNQ